MKKLILIIGLLMFSACAPLAKNTSDCGESGTTQSAWNGLSFDLPACWSSITSGEDLVLVNSEGTNTVLLTLTPPDTVGLTATLTTRQNTSDETVFVLVSDGRDPEAEEILISLTAEKSEESIASQGNCDAPDSTYPISTNQEWQGIDFDLPWCWSATETTDSSDQATLLLEQGEGEAWAKLTLGFGTYDGPSPGYMRSDHPSYSTFDFEGYLYLETNQPDRSDVQMIINSITLP